MGALTPFCICFLGLCYRTFLSQIEDREIRMDLFTPDLSMLLLRVHLVPTVRKGKAPSLGQTRVSASAASGVETETPQGAQRARSCSG